VRLSAVAIALAVGLALTGCGSTARHTSNTSPPPAVHLAAGFRLTSPAFRPGGPIPRAFTCDGRDISLPLRWSGAPLRARELILVMRDPDAPSGDFVHWALAGIRPGGGTAFAAGGVRGLVIPGRNSYGSLGYRGPCPPRGRPHHYVLTLTALASPSGLGSGFSADQLRTPAIAIATLIGTYKRR
jgi:Raf kinase inhibitor-like YbhB/YbcL family protein